MEDDRELFWIVAACVAAAIWLWRLRPVRIITASAAMIAWGSAALVFPVYFSALRLADGQYIAAALGLAAAVPIAAPYVFLAWPAYARFLRDEFRLWERR